MIPICLMIGTDNRIILIVINREPETMKRNILFCFLVLLLFSFIIIQGNDDFIDKTENIFTCPP